MTTNLFGNTHLIWNAGHEARAVAALVGQERAATTAILRGLVGWVSKSAEVFRLHVDGTDGDLEQLQQSLETTGRTLFTLYDRLVEVKNRLEGFRAAAESSGSEIDPDTYQVLRRPPIPPTAYTDPSDAWKHVDPAWRALSEFEDELFRATAAADSAWMDATYQLRALQIPFLESLVGAALGTGMLVSALSAPETAITSVKDSRFTRHLSSAERRELQAAIRDLAMPTKAEQQLIGALALNVQDASRLLQKAVNASPLPGGVRVQALKALKLTDTDFLRRFPVVGAIGAGVGFANDVDKHGVLRSGLGNVGGFLVGESAAYGASGAVAAAGAPAWAAVGSAVAVGYGAGTAVHSWATRGDFSEFQDHYLTLDHALKARHE